MLETSTKSTDSSSMMDDIFKLSPSVRFSRIHFSNDDTSQLQAIVAINSTTLGPALGGCRFVEYESTNAAVHDVLNLAQGMTYKAAFNRVPYGGGKAVIIRPAALRSRRNLMESYGDFIESLGGEFITAVDSGSNTDDMDIVAQRTTHVVCTSKSLAGSGDPSPHTARGVFRGIQAAANKILRRDNLEDVEVLIQGVGHVGYHLAKLLFDDGAKLSVSDIKNSVLIQCQDEFSATVVEPGKVYSHKCDILSPCALGQIINSHTIKQLNTKIIAGAANNQLSEDKYGEILKQNNIVFIPDFVINSGGLLQIAYINDTPKLKTKIENIYDSVLMILDNAEVENKPCNEIAIDMAKKVLSESENKNSISLINSK